MRHALLVMAAALLPLSAAQADNFTIDPGHTYPTFKISHLGFSTMHGRFNKSSGSLMLDADAKKASVEITIDAASIDTGHQKRDDHLRSPDFLNVAENPEITFKSTAVSWNGAKPASVTGDLTLMGVTKPVTLTVTHMNCGEHPFSKKLTCGFDATAKIKRSDFGVKYGLPAIGDDMELAFGVEAVKD